MDKIRIPEHVIQKLVEQTTKEPDKNSFEWTSSGGNVLVGTRSAAFNGIVVWDFEYNPGD